MPKLHTHFVCQQCGRTTSKSFGRCPTCGAYGTMVEELLPELNPSTKTPRTLSGSAKPLRLDEIPTEGEERLPLSIGEFSRVLGGGIVPGSIILVGGDPGIGKSTLLLQLALESSARSTILYVSGEESERQIKMRADRLAHAAETPANDKNLLLLTETNLETILAHVEQVKPAILVIDSIQTVYLPELHSSAGSVSQLRECASRLRELAKSTNICVFVIGHVTKEGVIAGPRVLEHIVDTVLYLEGDRFAAYRLLRSVKNRFGATSEVGVFEMRESGLAEVLNPSEAFLAERMVNTPGSAIAVTMEGTRPILVEVQGLTSLSSTGNPRRTPNGVDLYRLLMISAVLTRRLGMNLHEHDIFVNVVGGLRIDEPAADLAVAAAIASSLRDVPVKADAVLIGEVGLSGELRWPGQMSARLNEAAKLGFKKAVIPKLAQKGVTIPNEIYIMEARSLKDAIRLALLES